MDEVKFGVKQGVHLIKRNTSTAVWFVKVQNFNDGAAKVGDDVLVEEVHVWGPQGLGDDCSSDAFDFNRGWPVQKN